MPAAETDYLAEQEEDREYESTGQIVRAEMINRLERRNRVLKLRRDGLTYDQISLALSRGDDGKEPFDIAPRSIGGIVNRYVEELASEDKENAETLRQLHHERLERMFSRLEIARAVAAQKKDAKTEERCLGDQLRVLERQAKLHGLDAPVKHDHRGRVDFFHLADPSHVKQVEAEWADRFGSGDAPALPEGDADVLEGEVVADGNV